jgi:hypothetical protein
MRLKAHLRARLLLRVHSEALHEITLAAADDDDVSVRGPQAGLHHIFIIAAKHTYKFNICKVVLF